MPLNKETKPNHIKKLKCWSLETRIRILAQSAETVEYTGRFFAEG